MGQAAEAKPEGRLIDLWDIPMSAVHDPEQLKRIKGWIAFASASAAMDHPDYPKH